MAQPRKEPLRAPVASIVALALWRWRRHWFLLLMAGIGITAAVLIMCAVPLLSAIMQTASLRGSLRAAPNNSEITLTANVTGLSTQGVEQVYQVVNQPVSQRLGTYLNGSPRLDLETPLFNILAPTAPGSSDRIAIYGTSMRAAAAHVTLVQGRLPQAMSKGVEVAITPETAFLLHLGVGTTITLDWTVYTQPASPPPLSQQFSMRVVGIFQAKPDDAFWHGDTFLPSEPGASGSSTEYTVLADEHDILAALDRVATSSHASQAFFAEPSFLTWYYYLDPSRISVHQLDDLISQLAATQAYISANFSDLSRAAYPPYIRSADLSSALLSVPGAPSTLEQLRSQLAVARIPVTLLTVQILCLILFFVSTMATLLVDRQVDAITLLHSRGASRRQVFGAFLTQSTGLSLIALAVGPPLALATVFFIAQRLLPLADQDATNVISNAPVQALWSVGGYAALAGAVTVVAMLFSLFRASRLHFLAAASDAAARSAQRPLWQRFNLDLVAVVIALTAYGISVYLTSIEQLLDAQTQVLVVSPLALLAPIFLLLAALLLFLRSFPFSLQLAARFVMRARGAVPVLAVAQMARTPRRAIHMILLLALAIAFAVFTLVFAASQAQWAQDIAAYGVGADFSGAIPERCPPLSLARGNRALPPHPWCDRCHSRVRGRRDSSCEYGHLYCPASR